MNYYERHLGDYAKDTAHLTMIEHGAYCLLLDRYYGTESGIPDDQAYRVARARTRDERQAVDSVLREFFTLIDGVWINRRTEEEIEKAKTRIKTARENGKRGGRPKSNQQETQNKPSGLSPGSKTETQEKAHHTPDTINLEPNGSKYKRAKRDAVFPAGFPDDLKSDYLALRKAKHSPLTQTALDGIAVEAEKAGVSLEQAIRTCCERGWQGFKAEWVERRGAGRSGKDAARSGVANAVFGSMMGEQGNVINGEFKRG